MMTWKRIFAVVTIAALLGMVMGGLFGLAAGRLAPDFFRHLIPWQDVETSRHRDPAWCDGGRPAWRSFGLLRSDRADAAAMEDSRLNREMITWVRPKQRHMNHQLLVNRR